MKSKQHLGQTLASDIFTFNNKNYLFIIDYMSCFLVIHMLQSMAATHVTEHMKAIFSEYGVPKSIVTDNGPCYSSEYFKEMMKKMGTHHITTSPHHYQSNGLAEGYMRIIKSLLQKAKETSDDHHTVIFIYCSTPLSDTLPSLFEMLHGQKPFQTYHKFSTTPPSHPILFVQKTSTRIKQTKTSSP